MSQINDLGKVYLHTETHTHIHTLLMWILIRTKQNGVSALAQRKETGSFGFERCPTKSRIPSQGKCIATSSVICSSLGSLLCQCLNGVFTVHWGVFHLLSWSNCSLGWELMACWSSTRTCFLMRGSWSCCRPQHTQLTGGVRPVKRQIYCIYSLIYWPGVIVFQQHILH